MNKFKYVIVFALQVFSILTFGQDINNPLLINNLGDLNAFRDAVNYGGSYQGVSGSSGFRGVFFKLTTDIDMGNVNWEPIGTPISNFYGCFNGDKHIISNLRLDYPSSDDVGFFRFCFDATIIDLSFQGGYIHGNKDVGSVCANAYGTIIRNCSSNADVSGVEKVGQLVGSSMGGEISNCTNIKDISAQSSVGGIVGYSMFTTVFSCSNYGKVSGEGNVGGICGMNSLSQSGGGVSNCFNYGDVFATMDYWGYSKAGGICGYLQSGYIRQCANYANVAALGDDVGGICGFSFALIEDCINTGDVKGHSNVFGIGKADEVYSCMNSGLVYGENTFVSGISAASVIHACINVGDVYGGNDTGGIASGNLDDSNRYTDCINAGNVFSYLTYVGAIIGMNNADESVVSNCFWDKQMCDLKVGIGPYSNSSQIGTDALLTDGLTGFALQSFLNSDEWVFTEGLYPYPAELVDSSAARLAASPMFLAYADDDNYELSQVIISDFDITLLDEIDWHSTTGKVSFNDNHALILENGYDTLFLTNGQHAIKKVPILINPCGTFDNPLTINNEQDLIDFSNAVNDFTSGYYKGLKNKNDGFRGKYTILTNDLDMENLEIAPIGRFNFPFRGFLDGNNHVILNLTINSYNYVGLFGALEYSVVKNLNLKGFVISGESWIGSISGYGDESMIKNCHCYGLIKGNNNFTGGICGQIYYESVISDCSFGGFVEGYRYAGGITAGTSQAYVERCTNIAEVSGSISVGGIVGLSNGRDSISDCFNAGTVSATEKSAGGICGTNYLGVVFSNVSAAPVYCDNHAGGIIGSDTLASYYDNFYDNQMCIKGGIAGNDVAYQAEGRSTVELTGEVLSSVLGDESWNYASALYPSLQNVSNTDFGIVGRTPIFLQNNETIVDVNTNFSVGTQNNVAWNSGNHEVISIEGETAQVMNSGESVLTATRNDVSKALKAYVRGFYQVDDKTSDRVAIYPNPARNQLFVNADGLRKIKMYNTSGQMVLESSFDRIDITEIASGIYFVMVETDKNVVVRRAVVTK